MKQLNNLLHVAIATCLLCCAVRAQGSCLVGSDGIMVPPFVNPRTGDMCPDGFVCPNSFASNASTYPRVCPPTEECLAVRRSNRFCEPQGLYEPAVCPAGHYCPNGREVIKCPKGHWCPLGSWEPLECGGMSSCPAGTEHEVDLSGLFVALVATALVLAFYAMYARWRASLNTREVGPQGWANLPEATRTVIRDGVSARRGRMDPLTFEFEKLKVEVTNKKTNETKVLLQSLTGTIKPGQVTAIMGPSGSGKTVFFTTLLNKLDATFRREGRLDINDSSDVEQFREHIGYVPQDDVLHEQLTVEDNVYFSSEVRLPRSWSAERRATYRAAVLDALELGAVRNVIIGDADNRGVSGGQRKRASIAVELAAAPAALFLDEPTTGLAATAALDLCNVLNSVAATTGMTVAMVIHQPRVEIWNALDQVLFVAPGGFTVYQGSRADVREYFETKLRLDFSSGNPADVVIDGINQHKAACIDAWREYTASSGSPTFVAKAQHEPVPPKSPAAADSSANGAPKSVFVDRGDEEMPPGAISEPLGVEMRDSNAVAAQQRSYSEPDHDVAGRQKTVSGFVEPVNGASFFRQIVLLHNRSVLKQCRSFQLFFLYVVLGMIAAAVMGSAAVGINFTAIVTEPFTYLTPKPRFYIPAMLSMFYLIAIASTNSAVAIRALGAERTQFWREAATGSLNRLAYFIASSCAEMYRLFVTSLYFSLVAYFMWGPAMGFWRFWLIQFLSFLCMDAQAADLAMLLRQESAPLLTSIFGVFVSLLNGFPGIPVVGVVAFTWYAAEALVAGSTRNFGHVYKLEFFNDQFGYTLTREGVDYVVMTGIFLLYKIIGFVLLVFVDRAKQR